MKFFIVMCIVGYESTEFILLTQDETKANETAKKISKNDKYETYFVAEIELNKIYDLYELNPYGLNAKQYFNLYKRGELLE